MLLTNTGINDTFYFCSFIYWDFFHIFTQRSEINNIQQVWALFTWRRSRACQKPTFVGVAEDYGRNGVDSSTRLRGNLPVTQTGYLYRSVLAPSAIKVKCGAGPLIPYTTCVEISTFTYPTIHIYFRFFLNGENEQRRQVEFLIKQYVSCLCSLYQMAAFMFMCNTVYK